MMQLLHMARDPFAYFSVRTVALGLLLLFCLIGFQLFFVPVIAHRAEKHTGISSMSTLHIRFVPPAPAMRTGGYSSVSTIAPQPPFTQSHY